MVDGSRMSCVFSAVLLGGLTLPWVLLSLRPRVLEALDPLSRTLWLVLPVIPALVLASDWVRDTHTIFLSKVNFMLLPIGILLIVRAFQALPSSRWSLIAMSAWVLLFGAAIGAAIHTRSWALTPFEVVSETIRRSRFSGPPSSAFVGCPRLRGALPADAAQNRSSRGRHR